MSTFDPPPTVNGPADYDLLFDNLRSHGFNNIIFYVMCYAMANYPSQHLPWNAPLDVPVGLDPGWDPLGYAVEQAHARSMPLHAKINAFLAYRVSTPVTDRADLVVNVHPDWICVGPDGEPMTNSTDHLFFNPCHPAVQQWIYDICLEVVGRYAVDGLHFDYVRFPSPAYSWDAVTLNRFWARYGKSPSALPAEWAQWRRDQITNLLLRIKTAVRRDHWNILFAADVWERPESGAQSVLQDVERWREMHIMDFDAPMLYTTELARFQADLADHQARAHGRFVFPGIGAHLLINNPVLLDQQITAARDQATSGVILFKDQSLFPNGQPNAMADYLRTQLFQGPAASPVFPWKTKTELVPPVFAGLETAEPRPSMAVLRWQPAVDATPPITYSIFCRSVSSSDVETTWLLATQDTQFLVEGLENGREYAFRVRAGDDFANEDLNEIDRVVVPSDHAVFPLVDFEADSGSGGGSGAYFLEPNDSPYTHGLDATSAIDLVTTPVQAGGGAGRLTLHWTDRTDGRCFLAAAPGPVPCPDYTGWLSLWIHGDGAGTRIAAVLADTAMERTPFVVVDWTGWKRVEWFLPATTFVGWEGGNGTLSGGVFGGRFAGLLVLPGNGVDSALYFDSIDNEIRPDTRPPAFAGLQSVQATLGAATLQWSRASDPSNPVTYAVYRATNPQGFDFSTPLATTEKFIATVSLSTPSNPEWFIVRARDARGNEDENTVMLRANPGRLILEDFEAGTVAYWNGIPSAGIVFQDPNYSGTTVGVNAASAWKIATTPTKEGTYAGKLTVQWDDPTSGLCRVTTHHIRPTISDLHGTLSVWVHGAGDGSRLAVVLLDDLHAGARPLEYERTPFVTVDWEGWKQLTWPLLETDWTPWPRDTNGTGQLEDPAAGAHFDGFLLQPGQTGTTVLVFDEFQVTTPSSGSNSTQKWVVR